MVVYLFVVIQIYNKFSGFLLFFTIIYNLSLEMSDEPQLSKKRVPSYAFCAFTERADTANAATKKLTFFIFSFKNFNT